MICVLTGAAGKVAASMRPYLLDYIHALKLTDRRPPEHQDELETFTQADLLDLTEARRTFAGADAVVHLAGHPRDTDFETLCQANIAATFNVFEAARLEGVPRVIFASSNHAVGLRLVNDVQDENTPPRPDGLYGATKVFGEALTTLYADKHGMSTLALRIGHVSDRPIDKRRLSIWLHPQDLAQLVHIGITHPDIAGQIVPAVSGTSRPYYDTSIIDQLGYSPRHNAQDFEESVSEDAGNEVARIFQGGGVAANDFSGDLERTRATVSLNTRP